MKWSAVLMLQPAVILLRSNSFDLYLGRRRALVTQASDMVKAKVNAQ